MSTMMQKTLAPFDKTNHDSALSTGGSLLVKMDIEAAEFSVLKEVARTGTLCEYVKLGNNATIIVEYHEDLIKDAEEKSVALAGLDEAREILISCGVLFQLLPEF